MKHVSCDYMSATQLLTETTVLAKIPIVYAMEKEAWNKAPAKAVGEQGFLRGRQTVEIAWPDRLLDTKNTHARNRKITFICHTTRHFDRYLVKNLIDHKSKHSQKLTTNYPRELWSDKGLLRRKQTQTAPRSSCTKKITTRYSTKFRCEGRNLEVHRENIIF